MRSFNSMRVVALLFAFTLFVTAGSAVMAADAAASDSHKAGDAGHGEAHPEGVPLNWKSDLAIWSLVTFVLFAIVLKTFAWGPLSAGLNTREQKIHEDIASAERSRIESERLLADHAKKMEQVQEEIREIVAEARRDAERTKQDSVSEAQREAEATKQRAIAEINRAKDGAVKELVDG
ncbi:MAG: ATP synthase F0 subunit B, partial [Planctomycetaceae bacterium]